MTGTLHIERPRRWRFPDCPCVACCEGDHVGKCRECAGFGDRLHNDEVEGDCENCNGSGVCPECDGKNEAVLTKTALEAQIAEAETKAIDALARYKFTMFGYWAGIWVHLNRLDGGKRENPFRGLVLAARGLRS